MWPLKRVDTSPTKHRVDSLAVLGCGFGPWRTWIMSEIHVSLAQNRFSRIGLSERRSGDRTGRLVILGGMEQRGQLWMLSIWLCSWGRRSDQRHWLLRFRLLLLTTCKRRLDDIAVFLSHFFKVIYYTPSLRSTFELLRNDWWCFLYFSAGMAPHVKGHSLMQLLSVSVVLFFSQRTRLIY